MPRSSEGIGRPEGRGTRRGVRVAVSALAATVALGAGSATAAGSEASAPRSPEEIALIRAEQRGIETGVFANFKANTDRMPTVFDQALRAYAAKKGTTTEGFKAKRSGTYDLNITTGGNEKTGYTWKGLRVRYNSGQLRTVIVANGLRNPLKEGQPPQTNDSIRIDRTNGGWVVATTTPGTSRRAPSSTEATRSFAFSTLPNMNIGDRMDITASLGNLNGEVGEVLDVYSERLGIQPEQR